jgi:hypothetical protein
MATERTPSESPVVAARKVGRTQAKRGIPDARDAKQNMVDDPGSLSAEGLSSKHPRNEEIEFLHVANHGNDLTGSANVFATGDLMNHDITGSFSRELTGTDDDYRGNRRNGMPIDTETLIQQDRMTRSSGLQGNEGPDNTKQANGSGAFTALQIQGTVAPQHQRRHSTYIHRDPTAFAAAGRTLSDQQRDHLPDGQFRMAPGAISPLPETFRVTPHTAAIGEHIHKALRIAKFEPFPLTQDVDRLIAWGETMLDKGRTHFSLSADLEAMLTCALPAHLQGQWLTVCHKNQIRAFETKYTLFCLELNPETGCEYHDELYRRIFAEGRWTKQNTFEELQMMRLVVRRFKRVLHATGETQMTEQSLKRLISKKLPEYYYLHCKEMVKDEHYTA